MAVNIIINESVEITVNEAGVPGPAGTGALDLVGYQVIRLGPLGGNANAMTGAIPSAFSGMSVVDDVVFSITALGDNTVTNPTLDIGDGSGPQVIRRSGGGTLDLGELKDGRVYLLVPKVSGGTITEFRLLNNSVSAEIADAAAVDDDDLSAVDKIGIKPATASGALRNVTTGNLFLWLWKYLASQGAKTDLDDTDVFGLSDSDDNSAPKRVSWASIKGAIWDAVGGLIAGGDAKTTPVATDLIPISDSGSASATKSVTLGDLWANFFQGQVGGSFATTEQGQRADEAARHLGTTTGTDGDLQLTVSGPIPQVFSFSPHVTNTGATNLTINGTTYSVQAAAGGSVPAGYLEQDVSYLVFRFSSTKVRVIGARTAGDVGLGNVDNTSDADKPLSLLDKDAHAAGGMFYIGNVTYDAVTNTYTGPTAYDPPFDEIPPGSGHRILMRVATGNENVAADPTLVIGGATRTLLDRNIKSIEAGRLLPGYYTVLLSGTDKAFVWQVMKPEDIGLGNVDNHG